MNFKNILNLVLHLFDEPPFKQKYNPNGIPIHLRTPLVILLWMLVVFALIMGWFMTDTPESIPVVFLLLLMIMIRLSYKIIKYG